MARPTLVLIDGHALAYRQFYALPPGRFSTSAGEPTNATYGFTRTLLDLLDERPDYLAITFDQGMSGRKELYPDYKGTRDKMPDEMRSQLDRIRQIIEAFNIPILEMDGYEADDVLGTVAPQAEALGVDVRIITGDRDLLQLITGHTVVQLPPGKFEKEPKLYDLDRFREEYTIEPPELVEVKGLMGDTSDNIPGVKGVGLKTATMLITTYETIEGVYEHISEIKGAMRKKLEAGREDAFLSRELSRIRRDVPVTLDLSACVAHDYDAEQVAALFREVQFLSLIDRLPLQRAGIPRAGQQLSMFDMGETVGETAPPVEVVPFVVVDDAARLAALVRALDTAEMIAFDVETTSLDKMQAKLVGIGLAVCGDMGYYIPLAHVPPNAPPAPDEEAQPDLVAGHTPPQLRLDTVLDAIRPALTNPVIPKIGHNAGYDLVMLRRYGIDVQPITFDTMIAEWVIDPSSRFLGLKDLAGDRLGVRMTPIKDLIGSGKDQITFDRVPVEYAAPYCAADVAMPYRLVGKLQPLIEQNEALKLFNEIEMPLVPILADMEMAGVKLDVGFLRELSVDLGARLEALEAQAYAQGGGEFNLGSPKQLNEVLFDRLNLPTEGIRKTAHGFSTAADVLESLRGEHPIIETLMAWRELSKLQSTYVDALPALVNPHTGRVHTSFNQTGTSTGRLSSSNPNLQNIPIRTEEGRRVRRAFIAPDGHKLLAVDYSQVELRVLAHYSQDAALLDAFRQGMDIHRATAAAVFGIPPDEVSYEQRRFAKAVNFGLMYGMGAFRLARDSDLTLAEAEHFIAQYFRQFPGVRAYLDGALQTARDKGYVETLLGRRRRFPELKGTTDTTRRTQAIQRAEREAINMPVQGTAADILKIAMINLDGALRAGGYRARMILQVHDELVLEVPDAELDAVAPLVITTMESAFELDARLVADAHVGSNWAEMVGYGT
ncbi:MAG: DNA polymerase I [Anaerolineae bacterium]|nr:DNA polymerase I [Anaerolineae bacterium]